MYKHTQWPVVQFSVLCTLGKHVEYIRGKLTLVLMNSHAKSLSVFNVRTLAATETASRMLPNWNRNVTSGPSIMTTPGPRLPTPTTTPWLSVAPPMLAVVMPNVVSSVCLDWDCYRRRGWVRGSFCRTESPVPEMLSFYSFLQCEQQNEPLLQIFARN